MKGSYRSRKRACFRPGWERQQGPNRSRSEVLRRAQRRTSSSVITKNQQDESWGSDNVGYVLLRRVSAAVWRHFSAGG
jgi:hypothetical protein